MLQVSKINELAIRFPDAARSEGHLADIKTWGVEVLAHCCVPAPAGILTLVVTDHLVQAQAGLDRAGLQWKTNPVVLVRTPPHPAIAAQLGLQLTAAHIGIIYSYMSWFQTPLMHCVYKTTDDDEALRVLLACAAKQERRQALSLR